MVDFKRRGRARYEVVKETFVEGAADAGVGEAESHSGRGEGTVSYFVSEGEEAE
jgi:hypothetical protein